MSQHAIIQLEQQRRRELYLERLKKNVSNYLSGFKVICNKYIQTGYESLIPDELKKLRQDLVDIESNFNRDIEKSDSISKKVGNYIYGFGEIAKEAQRRLDAIERQKKEETKSELLNNITSIIDPIVKDFAYQHYLGLKKNIDSNDKIDNLNIEAEFNNVLELAEINAKNWKEKQLEKQRKNSVKQRLSVEINRLKEEENKDLGGIISKLEEFNFDKFSSQKEIDEFIESIINEAENLIIDETIRKETVKAVYKILKTKGFIVSGPKINKEQNIVTISAKRPSGNSADVQIELDGKLKYHFDGYKGKSCLKDINAMKDDLEDIYGFKVKEEVIGWQNPDFNYSDANSMLKQDKNELER